MKLEPCSHKGDHIIWKNRDWCGFVGIGMFLLWAIGIVLGITICWYGLFYVGQWVYESPVHDYLITHSDTPEWFENIDTDLEYWALGGFVILLLLVFSMVVFLTLLLLISIVYYAWPRKLEDDEQ